MTLTVTDGAGNQATTTLTITVQRDTDGDGIPDLVDADDDNDGIPDTADRNPKTADTAVPMIQATAASVTQKAGTSAPEKAVISLQRGKNLPNTGTRSSHSLLSLSLIALGLAMALMKGKREEE